MIFFSVNVTKMLDHLRGGNDLHEVYYSNMRDDHEAEKDYSQAKGKRK